MKYIFIFSTENKFMKYKEIKNFAGINFPKIYEFAKISFAKVSSSKEA